MADETVSGRNDVTPGDAYLAQVKTKRLMNFIMLVIFLALLVSGFYTADSRNAGGFWDGLSNIFDFPAAMFGEAIERAPLMPGYLVKYFPSLIETVNIAAAATLVGALLGLLMSLLVTRGLAPVPWLVS
ncbi:MAG: phosphonate transport system permease protein, partial [Yoonia sp.]